MSEKTRYAIVGTGGRHEMYRDAILGEYAARAETTIYVTSNGWHTGIAIARADLPPGLVPEAADFPNATVSRLACTEYRWPAGRHETTTATASKSGSTIRNA